MLKGYLPGTFDLFHIGHLNLIKRAKAECDLLIVGINSDEICFKMKSRYPIIALNERIQIVEAIKYVDRVVIQNTTDRFEAWKEHAFDKIFAGDDWKGTEKWNKLERQLNEVGASVVYFPYTKTTSSSLIRTILDIRTKEKE